MVHAVCTNNGTSAEVDPDMCAPAANPRSRMAACNSKPCPARWENKTQLTIYRVTMVVVHLGWVDSDLGSSPG